MVRRYSETFPEDLVEPLDLAILPLGALEWHGSHLPLGTDGILAEGFAEALAKRTNAVLLPTLWTPITTLPHRLSLQVGTATFRALIDDYVQNLQQVGFRRVALVTGHYAQGHELELYEAAVRAMEDHPGFLVFAATPLELLGDGFLDHAGRFETSQLLALRPDLVRTDDLPEQTTPGMHGILGEHPILGSTEEGKRLWQEALAAWERWLGDDGGRLREHYDLAFDRYQPYVDAYFTNSWEEAIERWWRDKTSG